jgi:3-oxoacyl-[acyl-carrier-protein] synthase II
MGEGSGVVVLEEYEHAKKRGANIYAEIIGYGMSGDSYHITAPEPSGAGAYSAMKNALSNAQIDPNNINYINAHGTSTPLGDIIELQAVKKLMGSSLENLLMSSTKSSIGHLLGAAGAVEAIFSILAMKFNIAPPTLNLDDKADEAKDFNLVAKFPIDKKINFCLSNSFGFGGTNASLVFKKV